MVLDRHEFQSLAEMARHAGYLLRASTNRSHPFTIVRRGDRVPVNTFADLPAVRDWLTD